MPMDPLIRKLRRRLLEWLRRSRSDQIYFMRRLSYKDVKRATDGFHRIIYSNSQVAAYMAKFEDGSVSLVKEIKDFDQADDIFYSEVQFLGRLHHRHLLSLKGFSMRHKRLLIFDSIENGSLKEHLNDPLKTPLNWRTRLQIALDVVAALEYLFLFIEQPLCHVSISSGNIMLDDNFTAKLSDFGLLTCVGNPVMMPNSRDDSARQKSGSIIFQLGVFILELVTGQSSEMEGSDLIEWIQESRFYSTIHKMVDPDLGDNYNSGELKTLLAVAKLCIKSRDKPVFTIPQLLRYLQQKVDIPRD
ncbi:probable receptor-like protein kinase At1g49730 isoform X2 [Prosopis cineraria]|uniref:probable receptor-like protein kinase At1g49730 isoform X2 n=1 Tax=Prosopis cineraria TaxID=364024 RepID=UPI00240FA361|nr:probable receptor-like protein kinase At1g49730 isoform X2 [Prosopis cineraria]XP_054816654.1 probable receptor-like protein kinase At1g49730 isoform X2 [Prosopis cineraria]